ncbi:hypothetical protein [Streptomyces katrae]|nr:hypothetical protein [Streptomyces katrae]
MRTARTTACTALGVQDRATDPVWGYEGRTLSGRVTGPDGGDGWLRLVSATEDRATGKLWEGPQSAHKALPAAVPRPALHRVHDWAADGFGYRAELYEHTPLATVSRSPVLADDVDLPESWWKELPLALDALATAATFREAVREEYIRRAVPQYTGHTVGEIQWSTAHGDFHWANLAGPELLILDWEGWGTAPYGFDAALLYLYALQAPDTATRVRQALAHILDDPAVRVAELTVCAQVLQAADRTPFYAALADPVRRHLGQVTR